MSQNTQHDKGRTGIVSNMTNTSLSTLKHPVLLAARRLARRVMMKGEMQEWLRAQIEGDPPPRRVKKEPDYKFPQLLEELENGKPGSKRFWELFPKNHDLNGPGPYTLNDSLLMDRALALDYPHLRKVEEVCHELANGVDQGKAQAQQG